MGHHTFLYARKSTEEDDRQILSLSAQETECRAYADRNGLGVDEVVREAHSARKPGRPLFAAMLQRAEELRRAGRPVRILCHKPDRLLRNIADWARLNDLMEAGVELAFVSGSYPNNAQGKMAFGINVLFAKYYVDNLSEEVRKGLREKIARGEWPGAAPLGYRNVDRRVVPNPVTAPLVREAFQLFATGEYSLHRLADHLFSVGLTGKRRGRRLAKNVIRTHLLSNPFYCGLLRYKGELHPGCHEPLVSAALFGKVQQVLEGRCRPKRIRHDFQFSNIFICAACGGVRVGDLKKGRYVYYRCSARRGCTVPAIREERLADLLRTRFASLITLSPGTQHALREQAEILAEEGTGSGESRKAALEAQARLTSQKLSALLDLRLLGQVSAEQYAAKHAELLLERAEAQQQLAAFEPDRLDPREAVERFIRTCNGLSEALSASSASEVRKLLRIVGSNYVFRGDEVDFESVAPFTMAAHARNRPVWSPGQDDVRTLQRAMDAESDDDGSNATGPSRHPQKPVAG